MSTKTYPYLGFGLGLRRDHYNDIIENKPDVDWFEIITENYLVPGGKPHYFLDKIRADYPMVMHGVSLSIGSTDPLDFNYLQQVKDLIDRIEPRWISDHLCWTGVNAHNMHDLLPLPYTDESINHIAERVVQVQEFLGRRILLENLSSYVTYQEDQMPEWDFFRAVVEQSDCLMLLDVNNIYVSSFNHDFAPLDYIKAMPKDRVQQIHLAGHTNCETHIIDTHDAEVIDQVWDLYKQTIEHFGPVSTMIERDDNIPPLEELLCELGKAKEIATAIKE